MSDTNYSVEEIIRTRAEQRLSKKQGIEFLREYREQPEKFLPLVDRQYREFEKWEDEITRNMCWDAGIYQDNCPYFCECWKVFLTTVVTVFISTKGIPWEPNLKNILVEFIRNGLIAGLSRDTPHIEFSTFTDSSGNEFYSFNMVISEDEKGQFITWGRGHESYEELNKLNGH